MRGKLDPYYRYQHEKQILKNDRKRQEENIQKEEERLKKLAEQTRDAIKHSETEDELDDLILDAKKSGNYDTASELLDRKAEIQTQREMTRLWIRHGVEPEEVGLEVLKKLKKKNPEEFIK